MKAFDSDTLRSSNSDAPDKRYLRAPVPTNSSLKKNNNQPCTCSLQPWALYRRKWNACMRSHRRNVAPTKVQVKPGLFSSTFHAEDINHKRRSMRGVYARREPLYYICGT